MKKIVILFFLVFSGVLCYAEQYEYRVEYRWSKYSTMQELTKFCNELATEGWRLVEVTSENSQMYMLFFEREKGG